MRGWRAQGRLTEPMIKRETQSHYEPIGWDEVFRIIGSELNALRTPDSAAFYTSGRASNESAFLWQLFARSSAPTTSPTAPTCATSPPARRSARVSASAKGTITLEDFPQADLIILIGQNRGPITRGMLTSLEHAKKQGAKIIAINPFPETGLLRFTDPNPDEYPTPFHFVAGVLGSGHQLADLHLPVRINGDIALLKGLMKVVLAEEASRGGVLDQAFIKEHTAGFELLKAGSGGDDVAGDRGGSGLFAGGH